MPCVVPQAWISVSPPIADDADGDLVEVDEETEATGLLRSPSDADGRNSLGEEHEQLVVSQATRQKPMLIDTKTRSKVKPLGDRSLVTATGHHRVI